MNPLCLRPNALHNDFWLCAPELCHTRSPKPRASLPSLRPCYLSRTHPDIHLLTITHTQSARLSPSQFCTASFGHIRIICASQLRLTHIVSLNTASFALYALLAELRMPAIASAELCQSGSAHRSRAMLHAHICCVALHPPLTALQH